MTYRTTKLTNRRGARVLQTRHLNAFAHACREALLTYKGTDIERDVCAFVRIGLGYQLKKLNPDFDMDRWMDAIDGKIETLS